MEFYQKTRGSLNLSHLRPNHKQFGLCRNARSSGKVTKISGVRPINTRHRSSANPHLESREIFLPSNPGTFFLYSPLPGRWPARIMIPHSPQQRASLRFVGCRLPSPAPPDSRPGARSSTSGVRGGDNGSGAGGAGRQLTGVCAFASWPPSRPAWALWGAGEPAAARSQSWRAEGGPVRGAAEAQHVKRRRLLLRGEPLSRPGWLRRPSSSR